MNRWRIVARVVLQCRRSNLVVLLQVLNELPELISDTVLCITNDGENEAVHSVGEIGLVESWNLSTWITASTVFVAFN